MRWWVIHKLFKGSLVLLPFIYSLTATAENINPFAEREGPIPSAGSKTNSEIDLSKAVATMTLQGTLISTQQPLANIDDELYSTGDAIGGYTVSEIRADSVTLSRGDVETVLKIEGSDLGGRER